MAEETAFEALTRNVARKLRASDVSPKTPAEWEQRRKTLRTRILANIGPVPDKPCDLEARNLGTLERDGYRIEKIVFQSRPDVWVTATAYVPNLKDGAKVPAVLAVHGHWAGARRDPVVQARCLGLVKLGFFVLAVDAFGAGERFTKPALGTYHGALYGSTLWPTGHSLLGMQVYDNQRAVDYLLSRKEVNGKLGITGASGGGNQSMNSGALDDRFAAVVPVCSVGNYQAYLRAACCVCEVMPNALTFTEEGDVLGLVAPRALLVMNATRDATQFSPPEAEKSVGRAKDIFKLLDVADKVRHMVFDSGHDYGRPKREAMYGWMTLHLKGEGKGEPIPEPEHTVERPEDLACYPDPKDRPIGFLTPPLFAGKVGRELVAAADKLAPDHPEMWEATANGIRGELKRLFGPMPRFLDVELKLDDTPISKAVDIGYRQRYRLKVEPGIELAGVFHTAPMNDKKPRALVVTFGEPEDNFSKNRLVPPLGTHFQLTPRGLRKDASKSGAIAGAPDHTPAEHAVWVGRPLLAQWTADTVALLRGANGIVTPFVLIGIGPAAAVVALAAAFAPEEVVALILVEPMVTYVTDHPYASGTPMGILAPGILKVGDIPHLAGMVAPHRLVIAGGVSPQGKKLMQKELDEAFKFTTGVYKATKAADMLTITAEPDWSKIEL